MNSSELSKIIESNFLYKQMGVPVAILSGYYSVDKLLTDQ
jgi:hypothetical protein